jgi:alkylation response protein AidB-like acyl-CoA dehydrogenase
VTSTVAETTDADADLVDGLITELLHCVPPHTSSAVAFLGEQYDLGLAWVDHPVGFGGLGVSPKLQEMVVRRLYEAGAPSAQLRNPIGVGHAAPTIIVHGTDLQRRRYLRPLFTSEEFWCQLFSEPGAGSDLANVSTRAVRDGDEWLINGQKVWTSLAHSSHQSLLLTRSDPTVPKHQGLTYFVIDMTTPGIEIRPLRQMTGDAEFNEVFLNDVRLPDSARLGGVGDGWRVAITTLMHEREANAATIAPRGSGAIGEAVRLYRRAGSPGGATRDRLMRCWSEAEVNRLTSLRVAANRDQDAVGPEGSIGKLAASLINQRVMKLSVDLLGADSMLYSTYVVSRAVRGDAMNASGSVGTAGWISDTFEKRAEHEDLTDEQIRQAYLRSAANQIEAGSSQVMRNILGERVLGLPGEPRVDRDVPWNKLIS